MADRDVQRRLAAILAADVAGYTRLMEEDTDGTVAAWQDACGNVVEPSVASHSGKIVKLTGDGFLAEFPTVLGAVKCALAMQDKLASSVLDFRIGINLGDIIDDGQDIHGEGVNIAARIEGLAEPGGICISGSIHEQVRHRLDCPFGDLGEVEVKNVSEPVRVFRVLGNSDAAAVSARPKSNKGWAAVAVVVLLAGAGLVLWGQTQPPTPNIPTSAKNAQKVAKKPSIAVLPFTNMSGDKEQEYFSDGMTEDLITDLSKISGLTVIARNSTFAYKGKSPDIRAVAKDLGVRFVLEGSVRKAGNTVRINAQLINAENGSHLWADRYDGPLDDVFGLQDKVTAKIVSILAVQLTKGEQARIAKKETAVPEAYDEFLKGWELHQLRSPEGFRSAIRHFKKALALDPNYARVYAALAATYWEVYNRYWHNEIGFVSNHDPRDLAETMTEKALKNPTPLALQISSLLLSRQGFHDDAIGDAERALSLDPNDANGFITLASILSLAGEPEKSLELIQKAMRLNPYFPSGYLYELGLARFGLGQFSKAAESLERASALSPKDTWPVRLLLAVYGHLGRQADIERVMGRAKQSWFGFNALTIKSVSFWYSFKNSADAKRLADGLRKAGVPD